MDNKILWVSEHKVDYRAIERQFPVFQKKFEAYCRQPGVEHLTEDGVFLMPVKAGTIRTCAAACSEEHQSWEDYEIHIKDIRQMAAELECFAIVLDYKAAPPPVIAWLSRWDDREDMKYKHIQVFIYWKGRLYFLNYLNMEEEL